MKHRGKRVTKAKIIKGCKGAISIFLCLLLTPVLTITLGLVEYSRYQQAMEITDEIYEVAGVSALSDYDTYIHDRFGLLAVSQNQDLSYEVGENLKENSKILGKQISISSPSAAGKLSLANTEVLRQQVVDVSELTVPTAVLLDDFNLEELLNKLQGITQFTSVMNTVSSLANTAESLTDVLDKLEALETALNNLKGYVNSAKSNASILAQKMADLYNSLGQKNILISEGDTSETIDTMVNSFVNDYLNDFKDIYSAAKSFVDSLNNVKTQLGEVKTASEEFVKAVKKTRENIGNISSTNAVDTDGTITAAASSTLEDVLKEMETLVNDSLSAITEEAINTAKNTVDDIINSALKSAGLTDIVNRYSEIVNGDYFNLPLTDIAKQDVVELLKTVKGIYSSKGGDMLINYFKDKFVPKINIDFDKILQDSSAIINKATQKLGEKANDSLGNMLTELVNIVKGLFDLDLFFEADMNAYVDIPSAASSSYQKFLDAVGAFFTAIEDFTEAMKEDGFFAKLKGIISAMGDMFTAIGKLLDAIKEIALDKIESIAELVKSVGKGDVRNLYEKLLISGYMRHNLPCRTDSGRYKYNADKNQVELQVQEYGITGFAFNDIPRPAVYVGQSATVNKNNDHGSKFQGLVTIFQNLKRGYGTDTMFKGAELEYIQAGTNSEIANQIICFFDLYFMRLLLDLPSVFKDGEVQFIAGLANVASWVVYILYVLAEPFCDTLLLVNGSKVPIIRSDCWLTASGLFGFTKRLSSAVMGEELRNSLAKYTGAVDDGKSPIPDPDGIDYKTHMLILLLLFVDSDTQISRLGSLIDLEASEYYRKNSVAFEMNKTYTAVKVSGDVTFNAFFDLGRLNGGTPFLPKYNITHMVSY